MKNNLRLLLLLLLLPAWGARAQTPLAQESFETDGEGTRYVSNAFDGRTSAASVAGAFPYFTRALTNPLVNPFNPSYVSFGTNAYPVTIGNVTGSVFWAAEAVEGTATNPNPATDRPAGVVTLNAINASNYSTLRLTVALADARGPSSPTITQGGMNPQNETNDFIRLQYSTDGGATYSTIGQFVGNNSLGNGTGFMQLDLDKDGVITAADGAQSATNTLDTSLRDFSFSIPGSPGALLVRVQIDQRGASEELAFDNIRVTGTLNTVAPPALANIESTAVSYAEGQAATQITNTLTVTNSAGSTLTGATVSISSGRVSTQDMLIFADQPGITGSFSTGTGVLTLSGTASVAAYQAALRSIAYQNSNTINATAGTRTIQFVVANGSVTSNAVSRNVVVTTALNAATTLPYREEFADDGEGTRYASNTFANSSTGAAWLRTNANPYQTSATSQSPTTFSGISNSFYWYGNNTNATANPSRLGTLQTQPINTAGYANLNFSLLLGASSGANVTWQTADYFRVSYRQVGTTTWIPLIQFRGNTTVVSGQGNLQRDADPGATAAAAPPTGTTLTPALASISAALPSSVQGQTLEFQLVQSSDDIRAELAFDNLQLTGTVLTAPTVTTATPSSITSTSAVLGGNVTADGGASVTERGVVYGTSANPTIGGAGVTRDTNGSGTGSFLKTISGLTPGTTYYVRAYAQNSVGTSYGATQTFTTAATAATVTTAAPTSITGTSAVLGGSVTADGGASVTERGVVYVAGTSLPTTSDTKVPNGSGLGTFSQTITGLRGNTTYTVRAYALNSAGTAYGSSQTFTTPNNPPTANADAVTVAEDSAPTVISVLTNDTSAPDLNETLTVTAVTQPANGTVTLTSGVVSFAPALNFSGTTSFAYTIADGNGGTATATVTMTVTPVNDAPVVTTTAGSTTFTPGAGAVAVDNGLTVADVDNATLASATVSIGAGFASGQDALSVTVNSGVTGTYTFSTGILMLTGTATVAQYQAILRSVTYRNSSATPNTATRTLNFTVNDGSLTSAVATKNVTFAATTSVAAIVANGPSPTNASTVAYTVTFANAVTGVNTSNFAPITTNLTGAGVASVTGAGTTYVVTLNTGTLDNSNASGSIQLQFNNSTGVSPVVTNTGFNGPAYVIDRTAPTATISSSAGASGSSTGTAPIPFTVTFSESVTGFSAAGITVGNGTVTAGSFSGSGTTYTFTITPAASGAVTVSVPAGAAQDAAGNASAAATQFSITYTQPVTAAPVVTTPVNNSRLNTLTPTYQGTAPAGSIVTVYVDNASIGTTTAMGGSFSLTQPTSLTEAQHTVYATAQSSGATLSAKSNTNTFVVDATAPTVVSINRQSPAANPTNATSLTYRVTFSEAVTGVTANDFSLTSTGTATSSVSAVAAVSTSVYDVTVSSASGDGTLRLDLNGTATGITDLAANPIGGGYTSGQTYTLDNTAPSVVISSTATSPTSTSPIPFTVTFSEAVTGFAASGITVTNGTVSSAITSAGNAYSFSVTPAANGAVTVSVAANAAQDAAGNGNAAAGPLSITYTAPITATTWTGAVSTDWYTAGNWTAGVPTATVDATINTVSNGRYPLISAGTAPARNLTINSGARLNQTGGTLDVRGNWTNNSSFVATGGTVALGTSTQANIVGSGTTGFWSLRAEASGVLLATSAGATVQQVLTLNGGLATNGNSFTLLSNATSTALVVNNSNVVTGTVTVQRYIDPSVNPGPGYRHYSAPVSNSTVADLATSGFAPVVNPAYNTSARPTAEVPFPTVLGYDDSRLSLTNNLGSFDKGFFSPAALSDPLTVGRGYAVNIGASEVVDFQGTLNNGPLTVPLTSTRADYPDGGWQLLGNPYPAPLDYSRVAAADRLGLESAIYTYSSTSQYAGRYRAYVNGIGNPVLPTGQGFFARVATGQSSATMTFRNSQRLTAPNGTTMQRLTADLRPLVQLTLQGASLALADEAYVYFEPGAGSGFEPEFDAEKLANPTGLNLSTSLVGGRQLSVDGQPELGASQRVVPLAVGVPAAGVYHFTASQLLNLSAVPVYLRDTQLGTLTDLRLTPTYQFTVSNAAALNTSRFELVFSPQQALATVPAALAQQVALYPNPAKTQVTLELPAALSRQPVTVALLDALGRVVRQQVLPVGLSSYTLPLTDLAQGLYSLRLATAAGVVVRKLAVE